MKKRSKAIYITCIIVLLSAAIAVGVNNVRFLFTIAGGLDDPSKSFYLVLDRIYQLSTEQNTAKEILHDYNEGQNLHLKNLYYRVLGVVGLQDTYYELRKRYDSIQHDPNAQGEIFYIITAMGVLGSESIEPFLALLLEKHDELRVQVSGATIASSLYLVTGKTDYSFTNTSNQRQTIILTDKLKEARRAIVESRGRIRSYKEMIIIDNIYRR